ncbi:MAG TPA: GTP-binding protein [Candidatus Nitrosopelagicus sp.]|jgi:small GTP-binding protein|nr:GTP-binding protein [Candidatus Nitrosopelagicus sp.]|tara:strand:- start:541 stop:1644 length:1104 start_codon:yes stop_codon:yes gene_type:complete
MGIPEKIKAIQDEMARTQINKATEHHIGLLKAKIAKLKREQEANQIKKSSKKSDGFDVKRSGDATVVFIGLPSVGKSTLLNKLTGSKSAVGAFQFTTLTVVPGVLEHRGAKIQMLDLPGIIKGASSGKGLGRRILSVARSADIVLLVLDVFQPYHENVLVKELENIGIRLNQEPPNIVVEKSTTGGIAIAQQVKLKKMSEKLFKQILNIYGYTSARVVIREDINSDQLVDFITGNKTYAKAITILNKIDLVDEKFLKKAKNKIKSDVIAVSADGNVNIEKLRDKIYEELDFIRIYMRPKGGETDFKEPLIIRKDSLVLDVCNKLHRKMKRDFRFGLVWGKSVKFGGQRVGLNHILQDEDVLTIIKQK